jgi:hypothetical protein
MTISEDGQRFILKSDSPDIVAFSFVMFVMVSSNRTDLYSLIEHRISDDSRPSVHIDDVDKIAFFASENDVLVTLEYSPFE